MKVRYAVAEQPTAHKPSDLNKWFGLNDDSLKGRCSSLDNDAE